MKKEEPTKDCPVCARLKAELARLRAGGQVTKGELERLEEFKRQVRENRR